MNRSKNILYDNCQALAPDGELLFYCDLKKAKSYLKKGIAVMISEDPFIFQLTFEPAARSIEEKIPKSNICAYCGIGEDLTKHHIIPYFIRKHMDVKYKSHSPSDVIGLCRKHHDKYEATASVLRNKLFEIIPSQKEDAKRNRKIKIARGIVNNPGPIPEYIREKNKEYASMELVEIIPDGERILLYYKEEYLIELWKTHFNEWVNKSEFYKNNNK